MKKTTVAVCASLAFVSLVVIAPAQVGQTPKPAASPSALPAPGAAPSARPAPVSRIDFLARSLNLTEDQKEQIRPIFDEETKQIQQIREKTQARLKAILTPEQWEKYSRPSASTFQQRLQTIVKTNTAQGTPGAPASRPSSAPSPAPK
jgi:Spy/CpxP family protein refolding chaperone